jgi:hypothetical protein
MLFYIGTNVQWFGERINGILYPKNINEIFSTEELSQIGLEKREIPVSSKDVSKARDSRISEGATITLSSGLSIPVQTRNETDFRNINGLVSQAIVYTIINQPNATIIFRGTDDVEYNLTPSLMIELGSKVAQRVQSIYEAAWVIKKMDPIPSDYNESYRWPV